MPKPRFTDHPLARLVHAVSRRPRRTLGAVMLTAALAAAATVGLRLETDLLSIAAPDDPAVRDFLIAGERFGAFDHLFVVLRLPEDGDTGPTRELADRIARTAESTPGVDRAISRLGEADELLQWLAPRALGLLEPSTVEALIEKVQPAALEAAALETRRALRSPVGGLDRQRLRRDPFHLAPFLLEHASGGDTAWARSGAGGLVTPDGRFLLVLVRPLHPARDVSAAEELVAELRARIAAEEQALRRELAPASALTFDPRPALAGGHAIAAADAARVRRDLVRNTGLAVLGVGLLFALGFRRLSALALAVAPLAVGLVWVFGLAGLTVGRLSATTASMAALLVGLAVDFSIVLLHRFGEEGDGDARAERGPRHHAGNHGNSALVRAFVGAGPGVVAGALTTAATLLALAGSRLQGLVELAWLTSAGILLCLLANVLVLPALLALSRRTRKPALRLRPLGSGALTRWALRRPGAVALVWVLLLGLAAAALPRLEFEPSIGALRSASNEAAHLDRELSQSVGSGLLPMILRLERAEPETLLEALHGAEAAIAPLVERGVLARVLSLAEALPTWDRQRRALATLDEARRAGRLPTDLAAAGAAALRRAGLRPEPFEDGLAALGQLVAARQPIGPADLLDGPFGPVAGSLVHQGDESWSGALLLFPPPDRWRSEAPPALTALLDAESGPLAGARLTGLNVISEALRDRAWADLSRAAPLALLLVWTLLALAFRSARDASLAFLPVPPGLILLLGFAGWTGIQLSYLNLFILVVVVGIGVDYGIHLVHRERQARSGGADLATGLEETGRAVVLAAATTAVGFGSLALSSFPGLRSVGLLAVAGALGAGLSALTLLPALFALAGKRTPVPEDRPRSRPSGAW